MIFWTEQRIAALKKDWADGYSAGQIQERLRCQSRSAVLGKVHRLGLPQRATCVQRIKRKPVSRAAKAAARRAFLGLHTQRPGPPIAAVPIPQPRETDVARASHLHLDEVGIPVHLADGTVRIARRHCRFPVLAEPAGPTVKQYCGDERMKGSPYCPEHHRRCNDPIPVMRPRLPKAFGGALGSSRLQSVEEFQSA